LAAPVTPGGGSQPGQRPMYNRGRRSLEPEHKINNRIQASQVRLVGENITVGVYSLSEALKIADQITNSTLLLFSAATPGQGGTGHINERTHEYWDDFFAKN